MSYPHELPPTSEPLDEKMLPMPTVDVTAERRAMLASFDSYITDNEHPDGRVGKLTAVQTETFLKVRNFVAGNLTHGLLQLACGYGKSAIATTTADALGIGRERPGGGRRQALLATSRNAIVHQFVGRNIQYGENNPDEDDLTELLSDFEFFAPRLTSSMYNKFDKNLDGDVVVTPYQSLGNSIRNGIITPSRFPIYFLDESQHLGKKRQQLLETLGDCGLFLGLSATPGKSREFLPTIIDKVSMSDGILKYGFLSDIKMHGVPTDCIFQSHGQANGDYRARDTEQLADNVERNNLIVEQIYEYAEYGPGLIKCSRQLKGRPSHIQAIAHLANENAPYITRNGVRRKLRVEAVSATIKGSAEIIDEFVHSHTIDALTFVDLIGEGFNMPRAKWGIWTPPTLSLNALEQFIGRGLRRDSTEPKKVFHFLQLMDTNLTAANSALGWELFDLPRDIADVTISKDEGVSYSPRTPGYRGAERQSIVITDNVSRERLKNLALDTTMRAPEIEGALTSLSAIQEALGVDRDLLKRVLFDGGYTAYPYIIDDIAVMAYQATALEYSEQSIAKPEDKTVRHIAQRLNMTEGVLMRWLHLHEAEVVMLYPRKSKIARRQIHLRPDQLAAFEQKLTANVTPLKRTEITLRDACEQAQATLQTSRTRNFQMRGFTLEERKITVGRKPQLVGKRAEMVPWIKAYQNARPAPAGFTPLLGFVKVNFGEQKASLEDVYIAAYNLGLKPRIFIRGGRERTDFIEGRHRDNLIREINNVLRQRAMAQQDPSIPEPTMGGCIYGSDETINEPKGVSGRQRRAKRSNKTSSIASDVEHDETLLPEGNLDVVPIKLQRAIMSRHHAFQQLNPRSPIYAEQATNLLQRVVNGVTTPFPAIPRNWVFLGDLAPELNIDEQSLVHLLVGKRISPSHACFIDINGIRGLLGFCSPELAQLLRNKG